jgi:hypothetical protein
MASDNDHTPRASAGPPPSTIMPPRYQFRLKAMRQNSTRVGSPGEMIPDYHLPVDDERHDVGFACRDGDATFEPLRKEDDSTELNGMKARFCELYLFLYSDEQIG